MYKDWLTVVAKQIILFGENEDVDLVLLRDHLKMLIRDIENDPIYKEQLRDY